MDSEPNLQKISPPAAPLTPRALISDAVETWLSFADALGLAAVRNLLLEDGPPPVVARTPALTAVQRPSRAA